MKFMFFNLMAVVAILYLVAVDGKPVRPIPDLFSNLTTKNVAEKGRNLAERARQKLAEVRANLVKVEENDPAMPQLIGKLPDTNQPEIKPDEQPVEVPLRPVNKVPMANAVTPAPKTFAMKPEPTRPAPPAENPSEPKQKYMSRAERRRELNRLARDMELMFADKLSE